MPLTCLRPSFDSPMNGKTFGFIEVSQCDKVSHLVSHVFHFPIGHVVLFFLRFLVSHCQIVSIVSQCQIVSVSNYVTV